MKFTYKKALLAGAFALGSLPLAGVAHAQEDEEAVQDTIIVTGARGAPRSLADSPVPVDVFSEEDIEAVPFTDTNDILRTLVPSFTIGRQPISDGASFIRPASLRGLPTDKTLVLVNSKRRHRAALVGIGGSGTQGPDIATIPAAAIKNVEVLRDGASAQYGSDAIAGVINFILKDDAEGGTLSFDIGEYYEGDGTRYSIGGNIGIPLGDKGFINISGEISDQEATVRAEQYCESFSCVQLSGGDAAFLSGVDTTVAFFDEPTFIENLSNANIGPGDVVQPWGVPNANAIRWFVNGEYELSETNTLYGFGNYSESTSDGSFFYRDPGNGVIETIRLEDGTEWSPLAIYPGGFTPRFFGDVIDYSAVGGLKGELDSGFMYDFSARYGYSEIEYTIKNTLNPSLGPDSPTEFDPGDLSNTEFQLQADFSQQFEVGLSSPLVVAFGASYLDEEYELYEGDADSYAVGPFADRDPFGFCEVDMMGNFTGNLSALGTTVQADGVTNNTSAQTLSCADDDMSTSFTADDDPVFRAVAFGSNGFPGYSPDVADTYSRDSYALYVDVSADVTEKLFLQAAARVEDYSDFGEEVTGKVAGKYTFNDLFGVRGSVSTGFRAPTPGQQSTTNVSTRLPNGVPVAVFLTPASSPAAAALGGVPLEPETSTNFTAGVVGGMGNFTYAVDFYQIDIADRIQAVSRIDIINDIDDPTLNTGPAATGFEYASVLDAAGVDNANTIGGVNFFQNAFDTTTTGVDVVLTYGLEWDGGSSTDLTAAFNWNETEFDGGVGTDTTGRPFLNAEETFDFENGLPEWRANLSAVHNVGDFTIIGRANVYGPYENADSGGAAGTIQEFDTEVLFDLEAIYSVNENLDLALGAQNIFDEYPDPGDDAIGDTCCGRIYRSDSIVDWQGGYYYARAVARF